MAYSFLVYDFDGNEEIAQQARHKVEGWKQGFRLDKKLQLKFKRKEAGMASPASQEATAKAAKGGSKSARKAKSGEDASDTSSPESAAGIKVIVRLDFSDHEKLSHQRWLERIPQEEPFKSAKGHIVRQGDPDFASISELFDSLDRKASPRPQQ